MPTFAQYRQQAGGSPAGQLSQGVSNALMILLQYLQGREKDQLSLELLRKQINEIDERTRASREASDTASEARAGAGAAAVAGSAAKKLSADIAGFRDQLIALGDAAQSARPGRVLEQLQAVLGGTRNNPAKVLPTVQAYAAAIDSRSDVSRQEAAAKLMGKVSSLMRSYVTTALQETESSGSDRAQTEEALRQSAAAVFSGLPDVLRTEMSAAMPTPEPGPVDLNRPGLAIFADQHGIIPGGIREERNKRLLASLKGEPSQEEFGMAVDAVRDLIPSRHADWITDHAGDELRGLVVKTAALRRAGETETPTENALILRLKQIEDFYNELKSRVDVSDEELLYQAASKEDATRTAAEKMFQDLEYSTLEQKRFWPHRDQKPPHRLLAREAYPLLDEYVSSEPAGSTDPRTIFQSPKGAEFAAEQGAARARARFEVYRGDAKGSDEPARGLSAARRSPTGRSAARRSLTGQRALQPPPLAQAHETPPAQGAAPRGAPDAVSPFIADYVRDFVVGGAGKLAELLAPNAEQPKAQGPGAPTPAVSADDDITKVILSRMGRNPYEGPGPLGGPIRASEGPTPAVSADDDIMKVILSRMGRNPYEGPGPAGLPSELRPAEVPRGEPVYPRAGVNLAEMLQAQALAENGARVADPYMVPLGYEDPFERELRKRGKAHMAMADLLALARNPSASGRSQAQPQAQPQPGASPSTYEELPTTPDFGIGGAAGFAELHRQARADELARTAGPGARERAFERGAESGPSGPEIAQLLMD
ncbi:MAG: hypothetical protein ACE5EF_00150, partial [Dehalococcoidia bacterium]